MAAVTDLVDLQTSWLFRKVLEEPTSDGLLMRALYDMTGLLVCKQGRIQLGRTMQW